jgi:RNA polymerase sigma factor (sigma-70 family)
MTREQTIWFNGIFEKYKKNIVFFCNNFIHDTQEAEDVATEAFVKLSKAELRDEASAKSFLYKCAKNSCINILKKKDNHEGKEEAAYKMWDDDESLEVAMEALISRTDLAELLSRAIAKLPEKRRVIFMLYFNDGLTTEEIADKLKIKWDTARVQKARALTFITNFVRAELDITVKAVDKKEDEVPCAIEEAKEIQYPKIFIPARVPVKEITYDPPAIIYVHKQLDPTQTVSIEGLVEEVANEQGVIRCKRNHIQDDQTSIINSQGYRVCRVCQSDLRKKRESESGVVTKAIGLKIIDGLPYCQNGHLQTEKNRYVYEKNGKTTGYCKDCKAEASRRRLNLILQKEQPMSTTNQYDAIIKECKDLFIKKARDYGAAWRILRVMSICDQLFIKAKRIRTLQETKQQKIQDGIQSEFIGLVNYGIIGLVQLDTEEKRKEFSPEELEAIYSSWAAKSKQLMEDKNHDYGEAWRDMRQESFVDLILMKLYRVRQILDNEGKTIVSEGIDANFYDIINYSIFALILIKEKETQNETEKV